MRTSLLHDTVGITNSAMGADPCRYMYNAYIWYGDNVTRALTNAEKNLIKAVQSVHLQECLQSTEVWQ
jgi:hypothetical protein